MGVLGKVAVAGGALVVATVIGWSVGRGGDPVAVPVAAEPSVERLEQRIRERDAALLTTRRRVRELERQRDSAAARVEPPPSAPSRLPRPEDPRPDGEVTSSTPDSRKTPVLPGTSVVSSSAIAPPDRMSTVR